MTLPFPQIQRNKKLTARSSVLFLFFAQGYVALIFVLSGCASIQQAVDMDRSSAPATAIYNKALKLYESGHWKIAKEYFHQYLAEYSDTPLYVTCLYYLGYCYQKLNDRQQAVSLYQKVIAQARGGDAFWADMAQKRIEDIDQ